MRNSLKQVFSNEQLQAINHFLGPALIVAGPGSGKTSVIVNRIINLIHIHNINPTNILVITFSKSAAIDMQRRFNSVSDLNFYPVSFGTFHSVFFKILKDNCGYSNSDIISINEKRKYIYNILKKISPYSIFENEYVDMVLRQISYIKNTNNIFIDSDYPNSEIQNFKEVFDAYNIMLKNNKKIDFDDMILECKKLLLSRNDIRIKYQNLFRFILLDEFQDINELQYDVVKLLLGEENNLFAVGDDDQAIYGFRGSSPEIMKSLHKDFLDVKLIKLSCNYRSTKNIVTCASKIISENVHRFNKNIYTNNELGEKIDIFQCKDIKDETENILDLIKTFYMSNSNSLAILFRTNTKAAFWADILSGKNIKFQIKEEIYNPYETAIFKDFYSYLYLSRNEKNIAYYLRRIINKPIRYVDTKTFYCNEMNIDKLICIFKDKKYVVDALKKLKFDLDFIGDMDMYSAFHYFRRVIGYDKYVEVRYMKNENEYKRQLAIMDDLGVRMKLFSSYDDLINQVRLFEHAIKEKTSINQNEKNIVLMTFHSSKGLEFDEVYIPDVNEGIIPNNKSNEIDYIEEERRMFYVACTRAKKHLALLFLSGKNEKSNMPSRFINMLNGDFCRQKNRWPNETAT